MVTRGKQVADFQTDSAHYLVHRTAGKTMDQRFAVIVMPDAQGSGFVLMGGTASHPAIWTIAAHIVEKGQKVVDVANLLTSSF